MKKYLSGLIIILFLHPVQAQFYNDGELNNDGALLIDWESQWFNTVNGVYNGSNTGFFEHIGPSSQTFVNHGSFSALTNHTDRFSGPLRLEGAQEIAGSRRPYFFNLLLINGATSPIHITNTDGANIRRNAFFTNGITTTVRSLHQAGALRFESGAGYTGGKTDQQHVDGYVSRIGTSAFTFPIGSGSDSRTLSIGAPAVPSEISAAWIAGDPGTVTDPSDGATHSTTAIAAPILSVSKTGYWDYILVSGDDDGLTVNVSIPSVPATAANLRLVGWNGSQWIDLSGGATATGNTENSTLSGTMPAGTTITALAIGSIDAILPVDFASFTVTPANCEVDLKWTTATELNNAYFLIERSNDGITFSPITQIAGAGNSSTLRAYSYKDNAPSTGNNYYRIRQVDHNGKSKTTSIQIAKIQCLHEGGLKVYPTIARTLVNVFFAEEYKNAQVLLLDMSGKRMPVTIQRSASKCAISMVGIPSGQYLVQIVKDRIVQTFKIVKP